MRQVEKECKKKKNCPEFRSYSARGRKFRKKYKKKIKKIKYHFPALFLAKMGSDWPKRREKNFSPKFRSYSTRARKFQNKKIQKMKKVYSSIISVENGLKEAEKDRENFQSRISFILHPGKKIAKKIAKKFKKLKNLLPALFLAKT